MELRTGDVHLWRIPLAVTESEARALAGLLDERERARADRIRLASARNRFVISHGCLRRVLARYLQADAAGIVFGEKEGGKPFLGTQFDPAGIRFSLSHSGDLALLGIGFGHAIGVDVEIHRASVDTDLVARRQFAPGEVARLATVSGGDQTKAFYTCWTRKEAYLKARGEAIIGRLQDFEVTCLPGERPEIRWTKSGAGERARWEVIDVPVGEGASAACVTERPLGDLRFWSYG